MCSSVIGNSRGQVALRLYPDGSNISGTTKRGTTVSSGGSGSNGGASAKTKDFWASRTSMTASAFTQWLSLVFDYMTRDFYDFYNKDLDELYDKLLESKDKDNIPRALDLFDKLANYKKENNHLMKDVHDYFHKDFVKIFNKLVESNDKDNIALAFDLLGKLFYTETDKAPFYYYSRKRHLIVTHWKAPSDLKRMLTELCNKYPEIIDVDPLVPLNAPKGVSLESALDALINSFDDDLVKRISNPKWN